MLYNILATVCSLTLPMVIFIKPIKIYVKDNRKIKGFIKENGNLIIEYILLVLGFFTRTVAIDKWPAGLNVDEASASYDAYSILNYGIDRNENYMPVFLEAWGSGQNALYSYLMIPFIQLFGLNIITTRLPMAIAGCISLLTWYYLLKNIKNEKFALLGLAILSICPWHIMKSRWGLESNIFPELLLIAITLIVTYLKSNKISRLYIAMIILGLTGYAYGTAYLFLPIFCISVFIYLLYKKKVTIKESIISFIIIFIVTLPIMLYVIINTFDLDQINLGFITIPKLPTNRYESETTLFEGNILLSLLNNLKNSAKLLIIQNDNVIGNCIPGFGLYYIISIPFLVIGLLLSIDKKSRKEEYEYVINIWFISAFVLMLVFKQTNINRINILIFPTIYYIIKGIYVVLKMNKKVINYLILFLYLGFFIGFVISYTNITADQNYTSTDNVKEVIEYVDKLDVEKIYFEYSFKEPYIYILYYTRYNVYDFIDTVEYFRDKSKGPFENVKGFGKYEFYVPEEKDEKNVCYVLKKNNNLELESDKFKVIEFEKYVVLEEN